MASKVPPQHDYDHQDDNAMTEVRTDAVSGRLAARLALPVYRLKEPEGMRPWRFSSACQ